MRILVISHLFPNSQEKTKGTFVYEQIKELSKHCKIKVISPVPLFPPLKISKRWYKYSQIPQKEFHGDVEVFYPKYLAFPRKILFFLEGILYFLTLFFVVKKVRKKFDFDLIHAHFAYPDGVTSILLKKIFKKPVILTIHGSDMRSYPNYFLCKPQIKFTMKNVDVLISPHPETTKLARILGRASIHEIPNGVDTDKFSLNINGKRIKKELNIENEKVITFVGNLIPLRDPQTFVEAVPILLKKERNIKFLLIGDGELKCYLENLSKRLGIEKFVIFTGFRTDINEILSASNVFVSLNTFDNIWATALLEAMSSRVPCIVTKAGETENYLKHTENAYLIEKKDPENLAEAILELIKNEKLANKLSNNGRKLIEKKFDLRKIVDEILELYKEVIE